MSGRQNQSVQKAKFTVYKSNFINVYKTRLYELPVFSLYFIVHLVMPDDIAGDGSLRRPEHRLPQLLSIALKHQPLVDNNLVFFPIFRVSI